MKSAEPTRDMKTSDSDSGRDSRPDLRSSRRDKWLGWTVAYFVLSFAGLLAILFSGLDAYSRGALASGHFIQFGFGILLFAGAVYALKSAFEVVIRWDCHNCAKRLESNVEWTCGSCDRDNKDKSFLEKCEHCKAIPKAFECYHCGSATILTEGDRDDRIRARRIPEPLPGETEEQARERRANELVEQKHRIARLEQEKVIRRLEKELAAIVHVPPDPIARRTSWLASQIAAAELDCKTIAQAVATEHRLIKELEDDPDYPREALPTATNVVQAHFERIRMRLDTGDIPV